MHSTYLEMSSWNRPHCTFFLYTLPLKMAAHIRKCAEICTNCRLNICDWCVNVSHMRITRAQSQSAVDVNTPQWQGDCVVARVIGMPTKWWGMSNECGWTEYISAGSHSRGHHPSAIDQVLEMWPTPLLLLTEFRVITSASCHVTSTLSSIILSCSGFSGVWSAWKSVAPHRPLVQKFRSVYKVNQEIAVDGAMIKFQGRPSLKPTSRA